MKKLLAILLTLAMLVPMCGFAEESAPQATLTTITFRDFNGRALMAEMEEAAETAYRDLLDALRVEVYRQGFTSCELFLNDQSIVDYGVQTRGADVYISGDVLGGTVYLNLDEDMRHIAEILHQWNASQSIYADAGTELSAKEVSESIAQEYENVGALLAKITKKSADNGRNAAGGRCQWLVRGGLAAGCYALEQDFEGYAGGKCLESTRRMRIGEEHSVLPPQQ